MVATKGTLTGVPLMRAWLSPRHPIRATALNRNTTTRSWPGRRFCTWERAAVPDLPRLVAADHRPKLIPVGAVEFGACAVEVTLHRAHRHRQPVGDVAVA